ncbi:hypothetical protein D3C80_1358520 [compost metagenome]
MATVDVLGGKVAVVDPVVQLLAPRQVGLHVAAIERVLSPGWVIETAIVAGRQQRGFTKEHILQLNAEMGHVLGAVQGLFDGLAHYHSSRGQ